MKYLTQILLILNFYVNLVPINCTLFNSNELDYISARSMPRQPQLLASVPFRVKFAQNVFNYKILDSQLTKYAVVGKLGLHMSDKLQAFLNSNVLNLTMKATRNPQSNRLFKINTRTLEVQYVNTVEHYRPLAIGSHYFRVNLYDAYNRYTSAACVLHIEVLREQVNNAPVFEKSLYEAQIVENNAPNTLVVKVSALEAHDIGMNAQLTYHFVEPSSVQAFQIESDTGEIFAKKVLNREENDFYSFAVMAVDNGVNRLNCIANVNVRVLANANKSPRFSKPEFKLKLSEATDVSQRPIVLQVDAFDADNSTRLIYSLAGSLNDMNTFEIDYNTGAVRLVSKLNYELKNLYKLNIVARDMSQPPRATYASLTVQIGKTLFKLLLR